MKTRKILGIVVLTLVLTLALGIAAYAVDVTTEAELRAAITDASTNAANPTSIVLKNDIEITEKSNILIDGKYINFSGGYAIIKANNANASRRDWGGGWQAGAFVNVRNGEVVFDGVDIDVNADDPRTIGGFGVYVKGATGKVTIKNAEIRDGGIPASYTFQLSSMTSSTLMDGMGAYAASGATFVMGENSKITGFNHKEGTTQASIVAADGTYVSKNADGTYKGSKLVFNGGEISGNTILGDRGIISVDNGGIITVENLKIAGNTYRNGGTKYSIYKNSNNGNGLLYLGSGVEFEGVISSNQGIVAQLIAPLTHTIIMEHRGGYGTGYFDNDSNTQGTKYYGTVVVEGTADHTLTKDDLNKVGSIDNVYGYFLDTVYRNSNVGYGRIYPTDAEHPAPDYSDIIVQLEPPVFEPPVVTPDPEEPEPPVVDPEEPETPALNTKVGGTQKTLDNGKKRLYLFAGIDNLNYAEVGFEVTAKGTTVPIATTTVYNSINVTMNGNPATLTPSQFNADENVLFANYIFGQGVAFPASFLGEVVTVKAYAMTKDGVKNYAKVTTFTIK